MDPFSTLKKNKCQLMKVMNIVSPATSQDLMFAGGLERTGLVIKVRTRATSAAGDTLTHMRVRTLNSYERERIANHYG